MFFQALHHDLSEDVPVCFRNDIPGAIEASRDLADYESLLKHYPPGTVG